MHILSLSFFLHKYTKMRKEHSCLNNKQWRCFQIEQSNKENTKFIQNFEMFWPQRSLCQLTESIVIYCDHDAFYHLKKSFHEVKIPWYFVWTVLFSVLLCSFWRPLHFQSYFLCFIYLYPSIKKLFCITHFLYSLSNMTKVL